MSVYLVLLPINTNVLGIDADVNIHALLQILHVI
jgi:hypothetical protein